MVVVYWDSKYVKFLFVFVDWMDVYVVLGGVMM